MKQTIARYFWPIVVGALGLVLVLAGVVGLTILRPATSVSASTEPVKNTSVIFTRGGVLPLFSEPVEIVAQGEPGKKTHLVVGRAYDVAAWAATQKSQEITGLKSWTRFETQVADKKNITPEVPLSQFDTSDLWSKESSGDSTAKITLSENVDSLSALAYCTDCSSAPKMTITWPYRVSNTLQWGLMAFGALLLLLALLALLIIMKRPTAAPFLTRIPAPVKTWLDNTSEEINSGAKKSETSEEKNADSDESSRDKAKQVEDRTLVTGEVQTIYASTGEIQVPTRRALRAARKLGVDEVEVEGVRYSTGSIPVVNAETTSESEETISIVVPADQLNEGIEEQIAQAKAASNVDSKGRTTRVILRRRRGQEAWKSMKVEADKEESEENESLSSTETQADKHTAESGEETA
ncbi:hypothetical protein KRX54_06430 [Actinomycetaceae bacterium TAE3-ERU4]|nr:hypothetical protein [Actinomycetaceae bacterium TAE3-ERU4]